jgi:hypothetical protein
VMLLMTAVTAPSQDLVRLRLKRTHDVSPTGDGELNDIAGGSQ